MLKFLNYEIICIKLSYTFNDTLTIYCVNPCMILTNTRELLHRVKFV